MGSTECQTGQLHDRVSVDFDVLRGKSHHGINIQSLVETVWAITNFVYVGDNAVNFVRHTMIESPAGAGPKFWKIIRNIGSFHVTEDMSAKEIASKSHTKEYTEASIEEQNSDDLSAVCFTQIVKQTALLITHEDDHSSLTLKSDLGLTASVSSLI
jgi:hypothetical protein